MRFLAILKTRVNLLTISTSSDFERRPLWKARLVYWCRLETLCFASSSQRFPVFMISFSRDCPGNQSISDMPTQNAHITLS
eukprot:22881_6